MGCSNSKVENEEGVARCKARKRLMKQAVTARHTFAASHAQFIVSLKGVGAAFRQFAEGEVKEGENHHLFAPDTPTTPPLALAPPPLPLPPPPPPMSPTLSPMLPPSPPPPSPPRLELPRPPRSKKVNNGGSSLARAVSSPESFTTEQSPSPPPPPPPIAAKVYRMEHTPPVIPSKIHRFDDSPTSYRPKLYSLEESSPPPPLITPIQMEEDWRYTAQTPPQVPRPLREGNPPPPPPIARSSWQDLFLDPFRPSPPSYNYMEPRGRQQEMEAPRSFQERQQSMPEKVSPEKVEAKQQLKPNAKKQSPESESKKLKQQQQQLEEDDIPDLEDIDDEDIDGPPPKDSDDEKDNKVVTVVEPKTPPKVQPESPKAINTPKSEKPPKVEQKDGPGRSNRMELAIFVPETGGRDLLDVLKEVDDCFLRAAESGESVSRMLETKKAHYHSSFSESLRGVGESARMLNSNFWKLSAKSGTPGAHYRTSSNLSTLSDESASITSMRSISNLSSAAWTEECGMTGSHASTLDRLFAWEKKLYIEVKEAEALRAELERKYALYRNQDVKGEDQVIIDKTRSAIKSLQTRMVVAIQAVDSAATAVQKLRDEELYPQLLELLEGMGNMWREMSACHQAQLRAVEAMKRLDNSAACEPTTSFHRHSTVQLESALTKWSEALSRVVTSHRDYLKNLTGWLRLSLMQFGTDEMERNGGLRSPSRSPRSPLHNSAGASPIYQLCQQWQSSLDQLPDRVVFEAIGSFAAVVREMLRLQWEELRIKKRVESYQREMEKREHALLSVSMREPPSSMPPPVSRSPTTTSGSDSDEHYAMVLREGFPERSEVADRRLRMEAARRRFEEEQEEERKAYRDTRAYTLNSLQAGLPQLFQAAIAFSNLESEVYDKLNTMGATSKQARITNK